MEPETATIECPDCYAKPGEPCRRTDNPASGRDLTHVGEVIPFIHNIRAAHQAYDPEFLRRRGDA